MVLAKEDYIDITDSKLLKSIKQRDWKKVEAIIDSEEGKELATIRDAFDNVPLHAAIGYQAPDDIILRLLDIYPDGCKVNGTDERLPLHIASMWGSSPRVVEALILAHPHGLDDVGEGGLKGRTPRYFAPNQPHLKDLLERPTEEWIELYQG